MRIITDFDGPIMDLSDRYYHVYQLCLERVKLPEQPIRILSQAEFWADKRDRTPEQQIGIKSGLTGVQAQKFKELRDSHAHRLEYLKLDRVIPGAIETLAQIRAGGIELIVMTLRRTSELNIAFEQYGLGQFFPTHHRYCLADDYLKQGDILDKQILMAQAMADLDYQPDTWMIGDTETDILAARSQGIRSIGVLSGIRNHHQLSHYQPDKITTDLAAALRHLYQIRDMEQA